MHTTYIPVLQKLEEGIGSFGNWSKSPCGLLSASALSKIRLLSAGPTLQSSEIIPRGQKSDWTLGTWVTDDYEMPCECWVLNLGPLQKQSSVLNLSLSYLSSSGSLAISLADFKLVVILWTSLLEWWVASINLSLPFVKILIHTALCISACSHTCERLAILLYHPPLSHWTQSSSTHQLNCLRTSGDPPHLDSRHALQSLAFYTLVPNFRA